VEVSEQKEQMNIPIRRHLDCNDDNCLICLQDHDYLDNYFYHHLNNLCPPKDWLGEYRKWLDENEIPSEINGWASRESFIEKNIARFISERRGK